MVQICQLRKDPFTNYAVKIMRVPDREYFDIAFREFKMIEKVAEGNTNIIKVFDIFYNTLQEKVYILMEYAGEGQDLNKYLSHENNDNHGGMSQEEVITIVMHKLLDGLAYLHSKGVCHRDIKPSNIYVTKDFKQLKILDFNVALTFTPG